MGILLQIPVAKYGLNSHPGSGESGRFRNVRTNATGRSISPSRVGGNKPPICFLCYGPGQVLAECPRLPAVLQKEAADNREAFQKNRPLGVVPLRALLDPRPWRPRPDREKWSSQPIWIAAPLRYMPLKNPKIRPRCLKKRIWITNIGNRRKTQRKTARGDCPFQGRIR
jgi:hypothetical protein